MTVTIWRLVKARHAGRAIDGEGARRYGGRWNSPGTRMVYASESRALAALELLVYVPVNLPSQPFRFFSISTPSQLVRSLTPATLPSDWTAPLISPEPRNWATNGSAPVGAPCSAYPAPLYRAKAITSSTPPTRTSKNSRSRNRSRSRLTRESPGKRKP